MEGLTRTVDSPLTASLVDPDATTGGEPTPAIPAPPVSSSRYVLGEEIARGGMGEVYRATDTVLNREVAVKLLQPRYAPGSVTARRFADEARITAQLQHPAIPAVHDLGALPDGRPFLAMKLIRGDTLDQLLKGRDPTQPDLGRFLPVFEQVCHALAYVHAHGVIHRDLKPANVMVGAFGETQVMDWGLAKVLSERRDVSPPVDPTDPDATADPDPTAIKPLRDSGDLRTHAGSVMGTPAFMAPEQAIGAVEKIDRRTDVFGLGAILAVILSGRPPYQGATAETTRQLAALGKVGDCFARLDACGAEPGLIALCKRCLSPDPADRPADAGVVAKAVGALRAAADDRARQAEIDRETATVESREQRKRRRVLTWTGGVVVAVLLAGVVGTSLGMLEAQRQTDFALEQEAEANKQAQIARAETARKEQALGEKVEALAAKTKALQEAETNLGFARKGNQILGSVFESLDPKVKYAEVSDLRNALRDNLKKAVRELDGSAIGDPLTVADMQNRLGISLLSLGEAELAIVVLTKARDTRSARLGREAPDTLESVNNLAAGYQAVGKLNQALPLLEETLDLKKASLGPDHPDTLLSMINLAEGYHAAGKVGLALSMHKETVQLTKAKLGPDHPTTLLSMNNLAVCYCTAKMPDKALPLSVEVLDFMKAKFGPDHPDTLTAMVNLASVYRAAGKLTQAMPMFEDAAARFKAKLGADHPGTLTAVSNLASCYQDAGKLTQALPLFEETLTQKRAKLGADHPSTLLSMANLASGYLADGKVDRALPLLEETVARMKGKLGPDHPSTLTSMASLAEGYRAAGQFDQTLPLLEELLRLRQAKFGPDHPDTLLSMANLGVAYCEAKQGEKAAPVLKALVTVQREKTPKDHPPFAAVLALVSLDLLKCEQFAAAEEMLRECLAIREKKEPNAWTTFHTRSLLGAALLGQKRYADAEPLLVEGYEGLKGREKAIPKAGVTSIPSALDRLVALYTATDQPAEAKKYRDLRAGYPTPKEVLPPPRADK